MRNGDLDCSHKEGLEVSFWAQQAWLFNRICSKRGRSQEFWWSNAFRMGVAA